MDEYAHPPGETLKLPCSRHSVSATVDIGRRGQVLQQESRGAADHCPAPQPSHEANLLQSALPGAVGRAALSRDFKGAEQPWLWLHQYIRGSGGLLSCRQSLASVKASEISFLLEIWF